MSNDDEGTARHTSKSPALDRAATITFTVEQPEDVARLLEFVAATLRAGRPVTITAVCEPLIGDG